MANPAWTASFNPRGALTQEWHSLPWARGLSPNSGDRSLCVRFDCNSAAQPPFITDHYRRADPSHPGVSQPCTGGSFFFGQFFILSPTSLISVCRNLYTLNSFFRLSSLLTRFIPFRVFISFMRRRLMGVISRLFQSLMASTFQFTLARVVLLEGDREWMDIGLLPVWLLGLSRLMVVICEVRI